MALLAAYNFEDISSGIVDQSGNGHDITTVGSGRTATGHTGNGLQASNAAEGQGPVLSSPSWAQTSSRSLMFWALIPNTTNPQTYPVELHLSSIDSGAWGILFTGGNVTIQARSASSLATRPSTPFPTDGLWHHYAATYDGVTLRLYKDGVQAATQAFAGPLRTDADVLWMWDGGKVDYTLDDVRFYDEALDQATIASLMNTPVSGAQTGSATVSFPVHIGFDITGTRKGSANVDFPVSVGFEITGIKRASATVDFPLTVGLEVSGVRTSGESNIVWSNLGGTVGVMDIYGGHITEGV